MNQDPYAVLGYPNSSKRVFYFSYWKRKAYELINLIGHVISCWYSRLFRQRKKALMLFYHSSTLQSTSQLGEDLVIFYLWKTFFNCTKNLSYLDIGAHHPIELSNTALLYENGIRGINIEADPTLIDNFNIERPGDINLNIGIGNDSQATTADFYVLNKKGLSTFSKELAEDCVEKDRNADPKKQVGLQIEKIISVPIKTINSVLDQYARSTPDFVSLDAEGLDYSIVASWDFEKYRPAIFCIETDKPKTCRAIYDLMKSKGYYIFTETEANTIFLDKRYKKSFWFYLFESRRIFKS